MLSRKLFCVNDPTHADFAWAAESRFLHMRKFDALGNTVAQWTSPVADTDPGEVRCTVCGGAVYVAGGPTAPGQVVACDFLGRCQSAPADANLARLDALAARLATCPDADKNRLAPVVAALFAAVADDPAASAIIEAHGLKDRFPGS